MGFRWWEDLPLLRDDDLLFRDGSAKPGPGNMAACLMCGKPFIMQPFIGAPDQICSECGKTYEEAAVLVCKNCNVTIARVEPGVIECGYEVKPRTVLHTDKCSVCSPGLTQSTVLEIDEWMRNHRENRIILPASKYAGTGQ